MEDSDYSIRQNSLESGSNMVSEKHVKYKVTQKKGNP